MFVKKLTRSGNQNIIFFKICGIFPGILPKEKPLEIKTVRIVKRESTERRKDRTTGGKRVTIGDSSLTHLLEDDVESDGFSDVENEPPIPSFASRYCEVQKK